MAKRGEQAVVVGASISGLLAARVLADYYRDVIVVERDDLPDEPANRRGVPQARHAHVLSARGSQVLEELFPGILDELVAGGVAVWDDGDLTKLHISVRGHQLPRSGKLPNPYLYYFPSRPFLEWNVLRRTKALPNVTFLEGHELSAFTSTPDCARITGVRVVGRGQGNGTLLSADLVVDATGRGSRTPVFLEELGYGRPREDEVTMRLIYASQLLRLPPNLLPQNVVAAAAQPDRPTTWALIRQENDTWILSIGAMVGLQPPIEWHERLSSAAGLVPPQVLEALASAEPLSEVTQHRVPSNRWRRYDKMRRHPAGLLVAGDAMCSFNPVYGQGMTVAALQAIVLRDCLEQGADDLPRRYFGAAAKKVRVAWQTAVGGDLAVPEVIGPRPLSMRFSNAYFERVLTAVETDRHVTEQFLRVTGMLDSPLRMLRPAFVLRVAFANLTR